MRLIDADALINGILSILKKNEWIHVSDMIKLVNNSRTAKNDKWIPVEERLPTSRQYEDGEPMEYLTTVKGIDIVIELYIGADNKWRNWDAVLNQKVYTNYDVIAWQPLPEVYMKGE